MSTRVYLAIGVVWLTSLVAVGVAAQTPLQMFKPLPEPKVMSGADVGFRVEGMYGDVPVGSIVVRVDGRWVEVRTGAPSLRK